MIGVEELRHLGEPLKIYNFEVLIPDPGKYGAGTDDVIRLRVDSCALPGITSDVIQVTSGGHTVKYAGRGRYSQNWGVRIREYEDMEITNFLINWHAAQWNRQTGIMLPKTEYSQDIMVRMYGSGGNLVKTWNIIGCFIESIADIGLSYEASGVTGYDVTFGYDYHTEA